MGRRGEVAIRPHLAVDAMVEEERVEDRGQRQALGGVAFEVDLESVSADRTVGMMEERHDLAVGELPLLAVDDETEAERPAELVVELHERCASAHVLTGERALLGLAQEMRLEPPHGEQEVAVARESGVVRPACEGGIRNAGQLELEEDEDGTELGLRLVRALLEIERDRVLRIRRREQRRVVPRPGAERLDRLVLHERVVERRRLERPARDPAAIAGGEALRALVRRAGVGVEIGVVRSGVEPLEVPTHPGVCAGGRVDRWVVRHPPVVAARWKSRDLCD